ncbi:hypothetical protein SMD44_01603 [Streptomyces alboflavus]|uniref:Uncharacterized protein n=1 Tax=Streptomyces alboflavus TaxID=67267 RepID=A0A1Z1W713_9ACTN|nr:hypothetical protein SMD44_01603 [Streptomyces alboflavus]
MLRGGGGAVGGVQGNAGEVDGAAVPAGRLVRSGLVGEGRTADTCDAVLTALTALAALAVLDALRVGGHGLADGGLARVRLSGARVGVRLGSGRRVGGARREGRLRDGLLGELRRLGPWLHGLRLAPRALGTRHQQQVVVLGGVLGGVGEGVRRRGWHARLLHPACALRQSLARDLAGVGHAYPSPIG